MYVDASAIIAILNAESDTLQMVHRLQDHKGSKFVSPLTRFEAVASLARSRSGKHKNPTPKQLEAAKAAVDHLLDAIEAKDITITPTIGDRAMTAAMTYGKIVSHEASLNFGDCFAYACATAYNCRLLYKGDDFSKTDLA